jgi:hypothetical protein
MTTANIKKDITTTPEWKKMTWQQKRAERFKVWMNPENVKFVSKEAEQAYKTRVGRFVKAFNLEEADRVPVMLPSGNFPAYHAGIDFRTLMYDYDAMHRAWIKFMDEFGDMDTLMGPGLVPNGRIAEAMHSKVTALPGLGLPENATMNQIIEGEYMFADEYDAYIKDPTDFQLRTMLPRTSGLFESFKKLPPLRMMRDAMWVSVLNDPDIRRTFETLLSLRDVDAKHRRAHAEMNDIILSRGYPSLLGFGLMIGAPFDHFADLLRGTKGISLDLYRQPEKLKEGMQMQLQFGLDRVKDFPMTPSPICAIPLHKGDDVFMSDKQFEEFYWPGLRAGMMAMVEEGLVPMPFAEGKYTRRLKQIADTPKGAIAWWFDQTDMAAAKKTIGDICCIMGNVPTSVVMTASKAQVKEACRQVIETCAPGGGYILSGGAAIDHGKFENLKAMMEAAVEYGSY